MRFVGGGERAGDCMSRLFALSPVATRAPAAPLFASSSISMFLSSLTPPAGELTAKKDVVKAICSYKIRIHASQCVRM